MNPKIIKGKKTKKEKIIVEIDQDAVMKKEK